MHERLPELTPEQGEIADKLIEILGFEEQVDTQIEMKGHTASLRYGVGFCARHVIKDFNDIKPDELTNLHDMIAEKIKQQEG